MKSRKRIQELRRRRQREIFARRCCMLASMILVIGVATSLLVSAIEATTTTDEIMTAQLPDKAQVFQVEEPALIDLVNTPIVIEAPEVLDAVEPEATEPELEYISLGEYRLTAYCACSICCDEWADGYTFSGTLATQGRTVAVDPKVIPLGSKLLINGNEYIAEDIGGAIKQQRIDVFFESHDDALQFGRQKAEVFLYTDN